MTKYAKKPKHSEESYGPKTIVGGTEDRQTHFSYLEVRTTITTQKIKQQRRPSR